MVTNRAMLTTISSTFEATGTKAPKSVTLAQTKADKIASSAGRLREGGADLTHAVAEALLADRDPFTDERVAAASIGFQFQQRNITDSLATYAAEEVVTALTASADEIVQIWRKPFDGAAAVLQSAFERIGDKPLDDSEGILKLGGDIAEVWTKARAANQLIDKIAHGWAVLGELTRQASLVSQYRVLRIADAPPRRARTEFRNVKVAPWDAVRQGLPLSLPSFEQFRQREAAVLADIELAQHEAEQDTRNAMQRHYGHARL